MTQYRAVCEPAKMERHVHEPKTTADRLSAFSDGVIAVIITVMVPELKVPGAPTFSALLPLWLCSLT